MYGLKIAGTDQVSFGPVPILMVVNIICSTDYHNRFQTDWERKKNIAGVIVLVHDTSSECALQM